MQDKTLQDKAITDKIAGHDTACVPDICSRIEDFARMFGDVTKIRSLYQVVRKREIYSAVSTTWRNRLPDKTCLRNDQLSLTFQYRA